MQFRNFAENLLGSRVKVSLVFYLLKEEGISSERELAKRLGYSPGAVNRALKELHDSNFILPLRIGTATAWQLNRLSYAYEFLTKNPKTTPMEDLKRLVIDLFEPIHPGFSAKKAEVKKTVIFGSIAEGRELPNSDIDLFLLVKDEENRKGIAEDLNSLRGAFIRRYGNNLSPNIFTDKDLKNPKNKAFLESVSKGIVVYEK
jgi:predicted nucleotidyltransferase